MAINLSTFSHRYNLVLAWSMRRQPIQSQRIDELTLFATRKMSFSGHKKGNVIRSNVIHTNV